MGQPLFKLNPDGTDFTVIKNLDYTTTGGYPYSATLMQGTDGALYGTTAEGGGTGNGTLFKLNPDGSGFAVLQNFAYSTTGVKVYSGLMQATSGAIYGMTAFGGSYNSGTVFKLNPNGTGFTVLKHLSIGPDITDGGGYLFTGLVQGTDGAFYGTTQSGGSSGYGTVFKLNPEGTGFTVLKNLDYFTTGGYPQGGALIQGTDGALYDTASKGGSSGYGTVFTLNPDGTGFTVLKGNFNNSTTGAYLYSGLMQGTDGALYGTTYQGGSNGTGTVFRLYTDGTGFAVLRNFESFGRDWITDCSVQIEVFSLLSDALDALNP